MSINLFKPVPYFKRVELCSRAGWALEVSGSEILTNFVTGASFWGRGRRGDRHPGN